MASEHLKSFGSGGWIVAAVSGSLLLLATAGGALWLHHLANRPQPQADAPEGAPGHPGGGPADPPRNVEVATVISRRVAGSIDLPAVVEPIRRSVIGSEIPGLVKRVLKREGEPVADGELLVELDHELRDLDLAQATATKASLTAKVTGLQAQLVQAEFELSRLKSLEQEGRATRREIVIAQAAFTRTTSDLAQANADINAQAEQIAYINRQIEKTRIRAPFAGQLTDLMTEKGQWLATGQAVAEVVDLHQVLVVSSMPDRLIDRISKGLPATVRIPDLRGGPFVGTVERIIKQGDPQAHSFPVKVLLDNDDAGSIKSNMFASCLFTVGRPTDRLLVPQAAVVQVPGAGGVAYDAVYRLGPPPPGMPADPSGPPPMMAYRTPILVGAYYGDWQVVTGQIDAGDQVVVRGNQMMANIPRPFWPVTVTRVSTSARLPAELAAATQPDAPDQPGHPGTPPAEGRAP